MDHKSGATTEGEVYTTPQRKGGIVNKLYPPGPNPGAKGRMKNHCRKFWWCGESRVWNNAARTTDA